MAKESIGVFKVGDIVRLKSGGPKMVVVQLPEMWVGERYLTCSWFVESKNERAEFPAKALERPDPDE